jgi:membrane-associated protease RseP (regulator of RpoE activity)
VSSHFAEFPHEPPPSGRAEQSCTDFRYQETGPSIREWAISFLLLSITFITTSFAGLFYSIGDIGFIRGFLFFSAKPSLILLGVPFSIPLVTILLAHELGHFFACRYYGMRCTPPFFIPAPVPLTGTLGAFIKIKSSFRNKRALFDIGIAGPLTGFLFSIPVLCIGIGLSKINPKGLLGHGGLSFGEPLLFRLLGMFILGYRPDRQDMMAHPMAMAGWIGLLATSLNLLPIWQLDGGHLAYSILGRSRQKKLSVVTVTGLILLSFWGWPTPSYLLFGVLLLVIGLKFHFYHPATLMDEEKIGAGRLWIGGLALLILILSFTPVPISFA